MDGETPTTAAPRPTAAFIAAVPIVLVNTLAVIGQCQWASTHLHWGRPGQALFAGALETTALAVMYLAHTALIEGDSAWRQKAFAYAIAGGSASVNWQEHSNAWHPTPPAFVFAGASVLSPILWATYSRFAARTVMREAGLIDRRAAKFSFARWLMFPRRTFKALRYSVWHSVQSPAQAITASQGGAVDGRTVKRIPFRNANRNADNGAKRGERQAPAADKPQRQRLDDNPALTVNANPPQTPDGNPDGKPAALNDNRTRLGGQPKAAAPAAKPASPKPANGNPTALPPGELPGGMIETDKWVEITTPIYENLRTDSGKRPKAEDLADGMARAIEALVAAGEFTSAVKSPSLSTAKRIREQIETRFPHLLFVHAEDLAEQEGAA